MAELTDQARRAVLAAALRTQLGEDSDCWLLDVTASALKDDPKLAGFEGRVSDSGEGRWTLDAAIDVGVPAPALAAALFARFSSRGEADFADRMLSAMRYAFGGHHEKKG